MSIITMTFAARDFSARRGASDEDTLQGSVRSEQRSLAEKELPPEGLSRIWPVAALLVGHRSSSGYAPSSRLAPGQIRRNERHRNYVHDHLRLIQLFLRPGPRLVGCFHFVLQLFLAECRQQPAHHRAGSHPHAQQIVSGQQRRMDGGLPFELLLLTDQKLVMVQTP